MADSPKVLVDHEHTRLHGHGFGYARHRRRSGEKTKISSLLRGKPGAKSAGPAIRDIAEAGLLCLRFCADDWHKLAGIQNVEIPKMAKSLVATAININQRK